MQFHKTPLQDCLLIIPEVFKDHRGVFLESYHKKKFFEATGLEIEFVQDNQSVSKRGVLRGLHFQTGEFAQAKLVQVIQGEVLDVVVDLRPDSPTFKNLPNFVERSKPSSVIRAARFCTRIFNPFRNLCFFI